MGSAQLCLEVRQKTTCLLPIIIYRPLLVVGCASFRDLSVNTLRIHCIHYECSQIVYDRALSSNYLSIAISRYYWYRIRLNIVRQASIVWFPNKETPVSLVSLGIFFSNLELTLFSSSSHRAPYYWGTWPPSGIIFFSEDFAPSRSITSALTIIFITIIKLCVIFLLNFLQKVAHLTHMNTSRKTLRKLLYRSEFQVKCSPHLDVTHPSPLYRQFRKRQNK